MWYIKGKEFISKLEKTGVLCPLSSPSPTTRKRLIFTKKIKNKKKPKASELSPKALNFQERGSD
jgi:hypothetical protein